MVACYIISNLYIDVWIKFFFDELVFNEDFVLFDVYWVVTLVFHKLLLKIKIIAVYLLPLENCVLHYPKVFFSFIFFELF